jgi:hypothetical protein
VSQSLAQEVNDQLASKLDYPSGGSDGDLLAKDGTDAEWIAAPEPGLTLITAESFSAVSSVSLNNCFTTTYENYRIMMQVSGSTTITGVALRMRASATDATGANYNWQGSIGRTGAVLGSGTDSDTSARIIQEQTTGTAPVSMDIFRPFIAGSTLATYQSYRLLDNYGAVHSFVHSLATSYDGFTLFPSSGTITGIIRVYGYRD